MEILRFKHNLKIGAASVIGPLHVKKELPNQDSYGYFCSDQLIAIAVADGLGSASHSDEGSSYATHRTVQILLSYLYHRDSETPTIPNTQILKQYIVAPWQKRFRQALSDYDTTLLFMALSPKVCIMGQIGDGLILYKHSKSADTFDVFHKPEKDYLNNPDSSLAQPNALECLRIQEQPITSENYFTDFLLMTDGVADDLTDPVLYSKDLIKELCCSSTDHWNTMLNNHLSEWPTPAHYDDKTLVVVTSGFQVSKVGTDDAKIQNEVDKVENTTIPELVPPEDVPVTKLKEEEV